jgi:hypothetical protein
MSKFPQLSFAGLDNYEPWAGGGQGFVPQEGYYKVKVTNITPELSKDGSKAMLKVDCVVQDQDVGQGTALIDRVMYAGTDKNGNTLAKQAADFMCSTGTKPEHIKAFAQQKASYPVEQIIAQLIGRDAFVRISFSVYNGQLQSNIDSWVAPEVYANTVKNNGHRGRKADQVNVAQLVALQGQGNAGAPQFGGGAMPGVGGFSAPQQGAPQLGGFQQPPQQGAPQGFGFQQPPPQQAPAQGFMPQAVVAGNATAAPMIPSL